MAVHLVRFRPDLPRLIAFASAHKTLPQSGDLGYGIHLALRLALGTPHHSLSASWRIVATSSATRPMPPRCKRLPPSRPQVPRSKRRVSRSTSRVLH